MQEHWGMAEGIHEKRTIPPKRLPTERRNFWWGPVPRLQAAGIPTVKPGAPHRLATAVPRPALGPSRAAVYFGFLPHQNVGYA